METNVPDSLAPGLNDQQLECLWFLMDGDWHSHREIRLEIRNYIPSNISGRIIRPLETRGILEQVERPVTEGSRKMRKLVRIRTEFDERTLHLLIEYSANDLVIRKKSAEDRDLYLKIRNASIKRLDELDKFEEKKKEEYWKNRGKRFPDSESWAQIVAIEKQIAKTLEDQLKPFSGIAAEEERKRIPARATLLAVELNPELSKQILEETHRQEQPAGCRTPTKK